MELVHLAKDRHVLNKSILVELQIALVLLGAPIFVFLDSPWFAEHCFQAQDINNTIMFLFFLLDFFSCRTKITLADAYRDSG